MKAVGKFSRASLIAASSLGAVALWRIHAAPPPVEDLEYLAGFESRVETFHSEDGVTLRLKRYINQGAQPVLLAHGYTGNGFEFDLPHRGHNLALFLAERGYDVWISSFRGCGREPYMCGINHWGHSVDHLAALDAPALVKGVAEATGKSPIWIGHSMGGIILYLYLQGIELEGDGAGFKVRTDPELARERNRSILGGITIGSPPCLHHGGKAWIEQLSRLPFYQANIRMLIRLLELANGFSPKLANSVVGDISARFPRLGRLLATHGPLAIALYNVKNVDPDVGYSLLKWSADNVTTRMTSQFLALALDPDLKDYNRECNYTANMQAITAPLFFITGSVDFVGPDNVRECGYERVASARKRFENFPDYGHTDLVMGKRVADEVYPEILAWIEELASPGTSS